MLIFEGKLINKMGKNPTKKHLFLTGYMGSGKSSVGALAASQLSLLFYDLDKEIERLENSSIADIFRMKGESYFRKKEESTLKKLTGTNKPAIIALGGGTIINPENFKLINESGTLFYLETSSVSIINRLVKETEKRPILARYKTRDELIKFVQNHLNTRLPIYRRSDFTINTDHKTISKVVNELISACL